MNAAGIFPALPQDQRFLALAQHYDLAGKFRNHYLHEDLYTA